MLKVLIITYYWPPMGGGGVQRWLKTSKYLREFGVEPIIFTAKDAENPMLDESLLKEIPEKIETHKVEIWEPFDLYRKFLGKAKKEKIQPGLLNESKGSSSKQNLALFVRGNMFIPDAKKFWIKPSVKYLKEYLKENQVDVLVSTGPPHTTHMIAIKLAKKFNLPWMADFRDPWTNIDFYDKLKLSAWADRKHRRLENSVLEKATEVVTVTWSWAKSFEDLCSRKIKVVTNGFDPADFKDAGKIDLDKKFTITHAGSMNADRNPNVLWEVLAELNREIAGFSDNLVVKLIGPIDISVQNGIEKFGLQNCIENISLLPHNKVTELLTQSQLLLLPLNNTSNIDGIVPGKLYEYLGAKRPIVCIGKPTGDSAHIINETGAGSVSDFDDSETLKTAIRNYYQSYLEQNLYVESSGIEKYSRKNLAGEIASIFQSMVK